LTNVSHIYNGKKTLKKNNEKQHNIEVTVVAITSCMTSATRLLRKSSETSLSIFSWDYTAPTTRFVPWTAAKLVVVAQST